MYDRGLWRYIRFFENPVDFINSPVYRDGCEFSGIFPENPVGLAGMDEKPPNSIDSEVCGHSFRRQAKCSAERALPVRLQVGSRRVPGEEDSSGVLG